MPMPMPMPMPYAYSPMRTSACRICTHAHMPHMHTCTRTSACRIRTHVHATRRTAAHEQTRAHCTHAACRICTHAAYAPPRTSRHVHTRRTGSPGSALTCPYMDVCAGAGTWACLGTRRHAARQTRGQRECARHVARTARPTSYVEPLPMGKRCHGSKVRQYPLRV